MNGDLTYCLYKLRYEDKYNYIIEVLGPRVLRWKKLSSALWTIANARERFEWYDDVIPLTVLSRRVYIVQ